MLYLHPMVQKAAGEVHFFDRDENYALGLEWYRSKMPLSFKGQITIEKSPSYFVTPEVSTFSYICLHSTKEIYIFLYSTYFSGEIKNMLFIMIISCFSTLC